MSFTGSTDHLAEKKFDRNFPAPPSSFFNHNSSFMLTKWRRISKQRSGRVCVSIHPVLLAKRLIPMPASVPDAEAEKVKKVKTAPLDIPAKKRKGSTPFFHMTIYFILTHGILATEDAAPVKVKKSKTPALPILNEPVEAKPAKKISTSEKADEKTDGDAKVKDKTAKKSNGIKENPKPKKPEPAKLPVEDKDDTDEDDDEAEGEVDDQTAALLKGFESDGDEEDALNEGGLLAGMTVPEMDVSILDKKSKKKLRKAAKSGSDEKPGVIYVGRIPHGFYENEMRAYFKQFGNILKLRLSRNKSTGASKHYAWIQFESSVVADIVAKTMDNYLMFGHLLKVKLIPDEQVPENLFKGANKRFKKVPWNKLEGRKLEQGKSETAWDEQAEREQKRRNEKAEKLKGIGYEFEAPKLKSAKDAVKEKVEIEAGDKDNTKAIDAAPASKTSKPDKLKAAKDVVMEGAPAEVEGNSEDAAPIKTKKQKKKKSKKTTDPEAEVVDVVDAGGESSKAAKKKHRAVEVPPTKEDVEESISNLITESSEKPKKSKKDKKDKKSAEATIAEEVPAIPAAKAPLVPVPVLDKHTKLIEKAQKYKPKPGTVTAADIVDKIKVKTPKKNKFTEGKVKLN
jgi:nucleolar protein 15